MPMDIEWAKDGRTGELFILQARPETVPRPVRKAMLEVYRLQGSGTGCYGEERRREGRRRAGARGAGPSMSCGLPARRGAGGRHDRIPTGSRR